MYVFKRNGEREPVSFDKIKARIEGVSTGLRVDPAAISQETITSMYSGISTHELDEIAARHSYARVLDNPDYETLAIRLVVSNMHKSTPATFSQCTAEIAARAPKRLSPKYAEFIAANAAALDAMVVSDRDRLYPYSGLMALIGQNLITVDDRICDRPQYLHMRVAVQLCAFDAYCTDGEATLREIGRYYDLLSRHLYTHASPTMFNACTSTGQINSCFLFGTEDRIETIMDRVKIASLISKTGGGIGMHMSNIRAAGTLIKTTGGKASGIPRQLRIFNECSKTWNQGGKRPGSMAIYLAIWHADIMQFIRLKQNSGDESERSRDLFYGVWCCDLFMRRLEANQQWSLFSEDSAPGLSSVYDGMHVCADCGRCPNPNYAAVATRLGLPIAPIQCDVCRYEPRQVFTMLYEHYERAGVARSTIAPKTIVHELTVTASNAGLPYICHADSVNVQSNQNNIDTIRGSNLCTEIMEVTPAGSVACCALASIILQKYVNGGKIDYPLLEETVGHIVRALDRTIDCNRYPVVECVDNASGYRPIGIGVQGLANMFATLRVPFLSDAAEHYDMMVFETIYYAALRTSVELARERGPYRGWEESPAARGLLHQDLWAENARRVTGFLAAEDKDRDGILRALSPFDSGRYRWDDLRADIRKHGLRHSLHIALMPTASTAQIFNSTEAFEPFQSHVYAREIIGGMRTIVNVDMVRELIAGGWWTPAVREIAVNTGSITTISAIPADVRELYRTVWEMPQKALMARAARRQMFVDQAQSLNIFITGAATNLNAIGSVYKYGWKLGLPTGSYYIRTKAATKALATGSKGVIAAAATPAQQSTDGDVCRPGCDSCSG